MLCSKHGFENYILYNPIKSICMVVKPHGYQLKCHDVYLNNSKPEYVVKAKNVGVNMKDDEDMLRHLQFFYAKSNSIIQKTVQL